MRSLEFQAFFEVIKYLEHCINKCLPMFCKV